MVGTHRLQRKMPHILRRQRITPTGHAQMWQSEREGQECRQNFRQETRNSFSLHSSRNSVTKGCQQASEDEGKGTSRPSRFQTGCPHLNEGLVKDPFRQ